MSACERVEYLSSSARVTQRGAGAGPPLRRTPSFACPTPDAPTRCAISEGRDRRRGPVVPVAALLKSEPGKVIGHEHRTLTDLAVIIDGRIVFEAKPDASRAPGYKVLPAGARIVNPGGGVLDIGSIELPDAAALARYKQKTGLTVSFGGGSGNLSVTARNVLKMETEVEVKGVVKPLSEWLTGMKAGEKLRCEAPFKASASEAAFIRKDGETDAIVYDVGVNTTYPLTSTFPDISDEDLDRMSTPAPNPVIVEMNARYVFVESISTIFDFQPGKLWNGEKKMPQISCSRRRWKRATRTSLFASASGPSTGSNTGSSIPSAPSSTTSGATRQMRSHRAATTCSKGSRSQP